MSALELSAVGRAGDDRPTAGCTATRHDDLTAYWQDDCRCLPARILAARRQKEYRAGKRRTISGVGAARRLRALQRIGWTGANLGQRLGVTQREISQLALGRDTVLLTTHNRVCALYDRLWNVPGPSARAVARAERKGWLPPLALDDDLIDDPTYDPAEGTVRPVVDPIAIERACNGDPIPLTKAERIAAVHRLNSRGLSQLETARRLRLHPKQVARDLDLRNVA